MRTRGAGWFGRTPALFAMGDGPRQPLDATVLHGLKIVAVVAFYFVVSISLVFLNKFILKDYDFPFPIFMTWYQQIVSLACFALFSVAGRHIPLLSFFPPLEFDLSIAKSVAPLTLVFVAMLAFNNLCLRYVEVWFYQVARSLTIVFSIAFTYMLLGDKTSRRAVLACGVVFVGFLVGSVGRGGGEAGNNQRSLFIKSLGIVFGLLSSVFVALYGVFVKRKLSLVSNNEWRLMCYNTALSIVFLLPIIPIAGETAAFGHPLLGNPRFWFNMTITGSFGFLVNIAMFMQVKVTSPLTNTISGTAKACTQTILAIIVWNSQVSFESALGIVLVIGGSFWYSVVRYQEMVAKRKSLAAAAVSTSPTPPDEQPSITGSSNSKPKVDTSV